MMKIIKTGQFKTKNPVRTITCRHCDSVFETNEYDIERKYEQQFIGNDYCDVLFHCAVINCPVCHKPASLVINKEHTPIDYGHR